MVRFTAEWHDTWFFQSVADSDFIDVPPLPKSSEPIILPEFIVEAIHRNLNTSSESLEQVHDEDSSHNSTAIEDITTFINENQDLTLPTESEAQEPPVSQLVGWPTLKEYQHVRSIEQESFDQLEAELIDDTAAQLHSARGNERLTATLTDTMHEDTQVRDYPSILFLSLFSEWLVSSPTLRYSLPRQSNRSRSSMCVLEFIATVRWRDHGRQWCLAVRGF